MCITKQNRQPASQILCRVSAAFLAASFLLFVSATAQAQTFQVLHTFTGGSDGAIPVAGLTMDRAGNLYGATNAGGNIGSNCQFGGAANGCGTVFKLVRRSSGWVLSPLYAFQDYTDGLFPSSRVIFGPDGALYGVTQSGGEANDCNPGFGTCGTVFRVTPPATSCKSFICQWQKTTILSFNGTDGDEPMSEVVFDQAGNLYGTTYGGGGNGNDICFYDTNGCGTVYELTPSNGTWTQTVLHAFPATGFDGQNPEANLIFDSAGNLYSSTVAGGAVGLGGVFQLSPSGSGWTESLLYSFYTNSNGVVPEGGLLLASGNLIGTTSGGGAGNGGTVFQLTPGQGRWTFNLIYSLPGFGDDFGPRASLTMDAAGNLYGTTVAGGTFGYGSAFKLTPSNGGWTYTSLHDFTGGSDGSYIASNLIMDADGNLYGVASQGASGSCFRGCGVIFEITP
jgi:uncharacterized repeat protein (TIGR03803 family)